MRLAHNIPPSTTPVSLPFWYRAYHSLFRSSRYLGGCGYSIILTMPTHPCPISVMRHQRLSTSQLPARYEDTKSKHLVQLSRELQPIIASLYISCPGRVLLGKQQGLSKSIILSKTIIYATSCRNNGPALSYVRVSALFHCPPLNNITKIIFSQQTTKPPHVI